MKTDWWPSPLRHIAEEQPWAGEHVLVAEIRSFEEKPHAGQRRTFSVLVPVTDLSQVKDKLAKLDCEVSTSGPRPTPRSGSAYEPKFWISGRDLPRHQYEPLVLSWSSHDKTVLVPAPGFLMTYGLSSRNIGRDVVHWDDPAAPAFDVVQALSPSVWNFPLATRAYVSISRAYLQDYLTLTQTALVQVFWEQRWGKIDDEIARSLGDKEIAGVDFPDRSFAFHRDYEDRGMVSAQVSGGRVVATPGGLPITGNSLEETGLVWPGYPEPITDDLANRMGVSDYVYVEDRVLVAYEGRPGFSIHPESGGVSFGTQWSIGHCNRVERNLIRVELKKLYEGLPPSVTRYWNTLAVAPLPRSAYPAALEKKNVAKRAKDLTFGLVAMGEALATLAQTIGLRDAKGEDFVNLRRAALEYSGWWTFSEAEAVSRHVTADCSRDAFLDRCVSLNKLLVEGLVESRLRGILHKLGVQSESIAKLKGLKLLDCIIRMAQVANASGLPLQRHGREIWDRLQKEGTEPPQPITGLFALYDIRHLKAHKAADIDKELPQELSRLGIEPGEQAGGFGLILDKIYDTLIGELSAASQKIHGSLRQ
jgi:hypothetical protein